MNLTGRYSAPVWGARSKLNDGDGQSADSPVEVTWCWGRRRPRLPVANTSLCFHPGRRERLRSQGRNLLKHASYVVVHRIAGSFIRNAGKEKTL